MSGSSDDTLKKLLIGFLVALPMFAWIIFVVAAGKADHAGTPATVNVQLRLVGVASGTALAAIAGSFLGVKTSQQLTLAEIRQNFSLSVNGWATVAYFIGLVLAVAIWALDKNRATSADVIQTALATLFGFGLGALKAMTTT